MDLEADGSRVGRSLACSGRAWCAFACGAGALATGANDASRATALQCWGVVNRGKGRCWAQGLQ